MVTGVGGAVGHYAVQWANWGGATVIATVSSEEKAAHARAGGADHVIDYRREDVTGRVREITGGAGVDRIVEVDFGANFAVRSEEHTSELQSLMRISSAVFCLKNNTIQP